MLSTVVAFAVVPLMRASGNRIYTPVSMHPTHRSSQARGYRLRPHTKGGINPKLMGKRKDGMLAAD